MRWATVLERLGDGGAALDVLRGALSGGADVDLAVWEDWIGLALERMPPGEVLAALPCGEGPGAGDGPEEAVDPLADPPLPIACENLRWLLERLAAREPLRINCGGSDFPDPSGARWSHDRFATGGLGFWDPVWLDVVPYLGELDHGGAAAGSALFRRQRWFLTAAGYRIPLPSGTYRVTLHFAELVTSVPARNVFHAVAEGSKVVGALDVAKEAGYATALARTFDVDVRDGILDLEIVPEKGMGAVAGIEIERIE